MGVLNSNFDDLVHPNNTSCRWVAFDTIRARSSPSSLSASRSSTKTAARPVSSTTCTRPSQDFTIWLLPEGVDMIAKPLAGVLETGDLPRQAEAKTKTGTQKENRSTEGSGDVIALPPSRLGPGAAPEGAVGEDALPQRRRNQQTKRLKDSRKRGPLQSFTSVIHVQEELLECRQMKPCLRPFRSLGEAVSDESSDNHKLTTDVESSLQATADAFTASSSLPEESLAGNDRDLWIPLMFPDNARHRSHGGRF